MRTIRIFKTGIDKNGKPFARGVADPTVEEQLQLLKVGSTANALFGLINGIPDASLAKLTVGDALSCETVGVSIKASTYEKDGETKVGTDVAFYFSGKVTRSAAALAECDW